RLHRHQLCAQGAGHEAVGVGGQEVSITLQPAAPPAPPAPAPPRRWAGWEVLLRLGLPLSLAGGFLIAWHFAIVLSRAADPSTSVLPTPWEVVLALVELAQKGLLVKYTISSLFRVTWAYLAAMLIGIPLGLAMGWFARVYQALN